MTPADKKDDILQAALILFAERGYYGTPVSLIAEKAGVGSGTIYRYFKDKDELVNVLYRTWKQAVYQSAMEGIDPDQPIRSLFRQMWERSVKFAMENREAFIFLEAHHHGPYLDEKSQKLSDEFTGRFMDLLRVGQSQQIINDAPVELLMAVIFGAFDEMMKSHWDGKIDLTPELIEQAEEMCWQAIRV